MFENLLHQPRIRERLSSDIRSERLPQSILFAGPHFSGKNTAALELARVLNCQQQDAPWDCSCKSCQSQRLLIHPDTLFLGRSNFSVDVQAAMGLLSRRDAPASRFMLVRNIRKLLRRFDTTLWEGDEKKIQKGSKALELLNQWIIEIGPGKDFPEDWDKKSKEILKQVQVLEKIIPLTVPISQIRRINHWSHIGSQGQNVKKIVIIDRCEQMQEGSRNALLKLLEEPPKGVYIILLSSNKRRILPTILSRLRSYDFSHRDIEASHAIQKRIFREEEPMESLNTYFNQFMTSHGDGSRASKFLLALYEGESYFPVQLFDDYEKEELPLFFQEMLETLRRWLRYYEMEDSPSLSLSVLERWNRSIRESYRSIESLNLSAMLMLEDLFYRLRDQL